MHNRARGGHLSVFALLLMGCLGFGTAAVALTDGQVYATLVLFFKMWLQGQMQNNADEIVESNHRAADKINKIRVNIFDKETHMKMKIPPEICALLEVAEQGKLADRHVPNVIKELEKPLLRSIIGTANPYAYLTQRINRHDRDYCSKADVERGRCAQVSATANWDISADILLTSRGYTDAQRKAAGAYVQHLVNPQVPVLPPKRLESTPQADQFRAAVMTAASRKSVALRSLGEIIAERTRIEGLGNQLGQDRASPQELLFDELERRFGSNAWYEALSNATPGELERRHALMRAAELKIALRQYRQNERIEALLATAVATLSELAMDERMRQLRAAAERAVTSD